MNTITVTVTDETGEAIFSLQFADIARARIVGPNDATPGIALVMKTLNEVVTI